MLLGNYLAQLPVFLALLAGIILALVRWRKHPRISLLALLGFGTLLLLSLVFTGLAAWLPGWLIQRGLAAARLGRYIAVLNGLRSLLAAVGWVFLIAAVFSGRGPQGAS